MLQWDLEVHVVEIYAGECGQLAVVVALFVVSCEVVLQASLRFFPFELLCPCSMGRMGGDPGWIHPPSAYLMALHKKLKALVSLAKELQGWHGRGKNAAMINRYWYGSLHWVNKFCFFYSPRKTCCRWIDRVHIKFNGVGEDYEIEILHKGLKLIYVNLLKVWTPREERSRYAEHGWQKEGCNGHINWPSRRQKRSHVRSGVIEESTNLWWCPPMLVPEMDGWFGAVLHWFPKVEWDVHFWHLSNVPSGCFIRHDRGSSSTVYYRHNERILTDHSGPWGQGEDSFCDTFQFLSFCKTALWFTSSSSFLSKSNGQSPKERVGLCSHLNWWNSGFHSKKSKTWII